MEKLKIFISGTQDDMKPERDAVDRAVNSTTLSTGIRAETAVSQPQSPRAWIEQQLRECNIYIGVYSHRYGWVIPGENVSATEFEFNLARKLGKPVLVWIRNLRAEEKPKPDFDRQEQFLNRVSDFSTGHLRQMFDDPVDLEKWVTAALGETFTEIIRRGTAPTTSKFLVPFPHNPDFVGRDEELTSLHEMLQQKQSIVGIRPTVLVGLGGIGKTQLAVEYAHAHRTDYPSGVFWLNAINPLLIEFSDLAEKLEMSDRDTPRDKAARKAWDYLDSHPDALVIFDNVLEPSELNLPFSPDLVPANLRCRTLFTTRQRDFPRTFLPFEVKVLPEMSAMRLLLRARPEALEEHHPEWGWARIVCAYLGWLPLALELAAAYLGAYPEVSITGYLERLRTEGSLETVDASEVRAVDLPTRVEEILKAAAAGNLEIKHQVAVSATLQTQWKRLDDDDARLLFRAAGQFPEASWIPIPRLGLLTGIDSEAKAGRPSPLNVVLKKLHAVSLIEELSDDHLRLHPLVQEFAARLAPASFRLEMAERVAAEFDDLMRLQARVIRYGVDIALEDVRTGLGFCIDKPETEIYSHISKMERVLDRQAHGLRNWNAQEQPVFFLQQLRNESFEHNLSELQARADAALTRICQPYLRERFKISRESAELVCTLLGHSDCVNGVALSADGRLAVSASSDKTLKVWDVTTGHELRTLLGHDDCVNGVALSADGRLAVSASSDKTLKVWDVATGHELRTLLGHENYVMSVALSADGRLAVSSGEYKLKVWDVATGNELRTLQGHRYVIRSVALSADGKLAVFASVDEILEVWDMVTDHVLHTLVTFKSKSYMNSTGQTMAGMAMSADGRLVALVGVRALKVWDVATGRKLPTHHGHSSTTDGHGSDVKGLALSDDGRLAVSASSDKTLKVWDVTTGHELRTLLGHDDCVNGVALSADRRLAISASDDTTLKVWDISVALQTLPLGLPSPVVQTGVTDGEDNADVATGRGLPMLVGHSDVVTGIALSADGRLAVSTSKDQTIKVWDVATGLKLRTCKIKDYGNQVRCMALSADGQLVVYSESYDHMVKVWDVEKGRILCTFKEHDSDVIGVALSADGRLAFSRSNDRTLKVWDVTTGRELSTLEKNGIGIASVDDLTVSVLKDEALEIIWRVSLNADPWRGSNRDLNPEKVALNSERVVVASDLTVAIPQGFKLHRLTGHSDTVNNVALSANGRLAASASDDQTLKVWDVTSGRCIATLFVGASVKCCALSADAKTIVAGDTRGGVHFLELIGADELLAKDVKIEKSWLALKEESE
jgi:WD40 repeat protein